MPTLIRPGLLVSLKTTVRGGVTYEKRDIEAQTQDDGASLARWETIRQIADVAEHEAARVARGKARSIIGRVCCPSSFGLLCPQANEDRLLEAVEEAQAIADAHNRSAKHNRLDVFVITGRIADSDEQAARAIGSEIRDLIAAMERGVRAADPEAIREAASKARALSGMLSADAQRKVSAAIAEVRKVAREIVARVERDGERAAEVVAEVKLEALASARFAVLDIGGDVEIEAAAPAIAGRALDLEPEAAVAAMPISPRPELDLTGAEA